jgi:hypothetical protein
MVILDHLKRRPEYLLAAEETAPRPQAPERHPAKAEGLSRPEGRRA